MTTTTTSSTAPSPPSTKITLEESTKADRSFWRSWLWAVLTATAVVSTTVTVVAFTGSRTRSAEARQHLQMISNAAVASYSRDGHFCGSASQPVPNSPIASACKDRADMFHQSTKSEWLVDADRNAGFACLGMELTVPQHYQLHYESTADTFVAKALGCGEERGAYEVRGHFDRAKQRVVVEEITSSMQVAPQAASY